MASPCLCILNWICRDTAYVAREILRTANAVLTVNGALPDPACTPGNINPALTKELICGPDFHTGD